MSTKTDQEILPGDHSPTTSPFATIVTPTSPINAATGCLYASATAVHA